MMCDKEALVGYIYDELGEAERAAFERHLAGCAECRDEAGGLRAARAHLAAWAPAEVVLPRFRIVREADGPAVAARRFGFSPAWGLAAAAVLLLAVASAIANFEVKYGADGLTVRTGWAKTPGSPAPAAAALRQMTPIVAADSWKTDLQTIEGRVRRLEAAVPAHTPQAPPTLPVSTPRMSDAELLRQVRAIVGQSELRQQRELALRVSQVVREFDAQRQADLVRVQQGLQRMQGLTDAQLIQHRDALNNLNYLVRVAQQPR